VENFWTGTAALCFERAFDFVLQSREQGPRPLKTKNFFPHRLPRRREVLVRRRGHSVSRKFCFPRFSNGVPKFPPGPFSSHHGLIKDRNPIQLFFLRHECTIFFALYYLGYDENSRAINSGSENIRYVTLGPWRKKNHRRPVKKNIFFLQRSFKPVCEPERGKRPRTPFYSFPLRNRVSKTHPPSRTKQRTKKKKPFTGGFPTRAWWGFIFPPRPPRIGGRRRFPKNTTTGAKRWCFVSGNGGVGDSISGKKRGKPSRPRFLRGKFRPPPSGYALTRGRGHRPDRSGGGRPQLLLLGGGTVRPAPRNNSHP